MYGSSQQCTRSHGSRSSVLSRRPYSGLKAFATSELQGLWTGLGAETPNLYGDAFGKFVSSEIRRWGEVVKNSGAKLD